jgi:hypothetical protein
MDVFAKIELKINEKYSKINLKQQNLQIFIYF